MKPLVTIGTKLQRGVVEQICYGYCVVSGHKVSFAEIENEKSIT